MSTDLWWRLARFVFWVSVGAIGYSYIGYPAVIALLARLRPRPVRRADITPSVTVLIAAYNEEACLAAKIENTLALDYPADRLDVVVVADGSTDGTVEIIARHPNPRVRLLYEPERRGKAAALGRALPLTRGEVVLFTDVRQHLSPNALRVATSFFADPQVGAVVGDLVLESAKGPGVYWSYEKCIRIAEAEFDSVVGGSGCCTAIRRHLFRPLPEDILLDDMWLPLQIVLAGYRVLYRPEVQVFDREAPVAGEVARKARTLAGNFQLLEKMPDLLNPRRNRLFFQLVSHKLMRLGCPLALLGLFGSNLVLVLAGAPPWPLYVLTLALQVGGYALALRGAAQGVRAGRLARLSHTFVSLNVAALEGLSRYLSEDLRWTTMRHPAAGGRP